MLRSGAIVQQDESVVQLDQRIETIQRQRRKWAEKAMAGVVPNDIARERQLELASQLATAESRRSQLGVTQAHHEQVLREATALLPQCGEAYRRGGDQQRRDYNQPWFERIFISVKDGQPVVARVQRTKVFEALHTAEVEPKDQEKTTARAGSSFRPVLNASNGGQDEPEVSSDTERRGSVRYRVISFVGGSKVACLVGLAGLEPATSSLSGMRSNQLSYRP